MAVHIISTMIQYSKFASNAIEFAKLAFLQMIRIACHVRGGKIYLALQSMKKHANHAIKTYSTKVWIMEVHVWKFVGMEKITGFLSVKTEIISMGMVVPLIAKWKQAIHVREVRRLPRVNVCHLKHILSK